MRFYNNRCVVKEVELPSRTARLFCEFSLLEEYVYVCKMCDKKFGGCWWSFVWSVQKIKDIMRSSCRPSRLYATSFC